MSGLLLALTLATAPGLGAPPNPLHVVRLTSKKDASLYCSAFFPDGKTVVFCGGYFLGPGELLYWDVKSGKIKHAHTEHKLAIKSVAISPNGELVATGGGFGEVKVWDANGKVVASFSGLAEYTEDLHFSPNGKWLAHCGGRLVIRETDKFTIVAEPFKADGFGLLGSFSPDGKIIVGSSAHGQIPFVHVPGWKETAYHTRIIDQEYYRSLFSPIGTTLIVHTLVRKKDKDRTYLHMVEAWSISGSELGKKRFEVPGHYLGTAFTPDGKYLLLGELKLEAECRIRVWEVSSGREVRSWVASAKGIRHLAVSPDGSLLVSCDDNDDGKIWSLKKILEGE